MRSVMTVSLDNKLKMRVEKFAKAHNLKRGEVVKTALQRYLNLEEFEELRSRLIPYAEKAGIFTDEDVYSKLK